MARLKKKNIIIYIVIGIILFIAVGPIAWMVISSFKSRVDIISYPPKFIFSPVLENYARILARETLLRSIKNSLTVVLASLSLGFIFGVPTAYVFARLSFRGNADLRFFVLTLRFMPPVAVVIPFFILWLRLGLLDRVPSLVVTYLLITISVMIWLTIECFKRVPIECEEAALLDGCTQFQIFYKIALPIALPSLLGMTIFTFILIWNEFFLAFVLTSSRAITMPVASAAFAVVGMEVPWGQVCASITLLSIPPFILAYFFLKFLPHFFKVR